MQFRRQLRYHLVRLLHLSYSEVDSLIREGRVSVAGEWVQDPFFACDKHQEIRLNGVQIRPGKTFFYLLWHKPFGIECTRNASIPNNLLSALPEAFHSAFPLGRLDLNSEGLLLLTNDGDFYKRWMDPNFEIEKTYEVLTRDPLTASLQTAFEQPFQLGPRLTRPARFTPTGSHSFQVVLTEGINRQIRRICAKCGNQVVQLKRIRFGPFELGDLLPGAFRLLDRM
jgi:23S rRNA pseudouridine2604 synthase